MTISVFDHPILSALLGDEEVSRVFSAEADIRAILTFEKALASAQATLGVIPPEAAARIGEACDKFSPEIAKLASGVAQDGVIVPTLVKLLREKIAEPYAAKVHLGATSRDAIDTRLVLRLKLLVGAFARRLDALIALLRPIAAEQGATPLMARCRTDTPLPIDAAA